MKLSRPAFEAQRYMLKNIRTFKFNYYIIVSISIIICDQLFGQSLKFKDHTPCISNKKSFKLNLSITVKENAINFGYQQYYKDLSLPSSYFRHYNENNISKNGFSMNRTPSYDKIKNIFTSDKDKYNLKFLNNFLFLVPPLAWNIAYGSNNPAQLGFFEGDAPNSILISENIFRITSILYPIFLPVNSKNKYFKSGLITYVAGLMIYFSSWAYLMNYPESNFSQNPILRFAPAYTPFIWLSGISLMSNSKIHFTLSGIFISLHVTEYLFRY